MYFLVFAVIILGTIENIWPIIAGFAATPKGYIFLGTVHHPGDYFYYLSQFTQGVSGLLQTQNLYTSERIPLTFVGWFNVLVGHLFSVIGFSSISTYHIG